MYKPSYFLLACFWIVSATAADVSSVTEPEASTVAISNAPDSKQLETDLQQLNWKQFKSVVEAVPKLKADVDAYGEFGWQYVQMNYKTYKWKKSIDRLDDGQKHQLAGLIRNVLQAQ
jgi:hypothetical protein